MTAQRKHNENNGYYDYSEYSEYSENEENNDLICEPSNAMPVDVFTKPLPMRELWACLRRLGMGRYRDGPPSLEDLEVSQAVVPVELDAPEDSP